MGSGMNSLAAVSDINQRRPRGYTRVRAADGDVYVQPEDQLSLQDAAELTVKRWLGSEGAQRHVGQAALIAMAPDGAILAMVGGRDYGERQFNRATQAKRQPGSLFKIFVYLTALSNGYTPDSVVVTARSSGGVPTSAFASASAASTK